MLCACICLLHLQLKRWLHQRRCGVECWWKTLKTPHTQTPSISIQFARISTSHHAATSILNFWPRLPERCRRFKSNSYNHPDFHKSGWNCSQRQWRKRNFYIKGGCQPITIYPEYKRRMCLPLTRKLVKYHFKSGQFDLCKCDEFWQHRSKINIAKVKTRITRYRIDSNSGFSTSS